MSIAALIRSMAAAGAPPEAIAIAVEAIEGATAVVDDGRALARDRKRRQRERDKSRDGHVTVTSDAVTDPAPSPLPLLSPQTPQITPTPLPHPEGITAYAKGWISIIACSVIEAGCVAAKAPAKPKRRWPPDMPPPPGVSDDQWAGFIDHRRAKGAAPTLRAYQLLCGKLANHADDEWPPGRIVDQIVERRWTSFEPEWLPRANETRNGKRPEYDRPSGWAARPGMEGAEPAYLHD